MSTEDAPLHPAPTGARNYHHYALKQLLQAQRRDLSRLIRDYALSADRECEATEGILADLLDIEAGYAVVDGALSTAISMADRKAVRR